MVPESSEIAIKTIQELPGDATWEDIRERISFVAAVRRGLRRLDEGKGIPHDTVREEFADARFGSPLALGYLLVSLTIAR